MLFAKANTLARKRRHERLQEIRKEFSKKDHHLYNKDPYSSTEKKFFLRVLTSGIALFLISSVLPSFFYTESDFWLSDEVSAQDFTSENFALADEGFLIKPEIQTKKGDRVGINEIVTMTVEAGDTVSSIAYRYGVSVATVVQNNNITNANSLKPGQQLTILPVDGLLHEVVKDETVAAIAKKYSVEEDKIISQNNINAEAGLQIGQKLIIPGAQKEISTPAMLAGGNSGSSGSAFTNPPSGSGATSDYGGTLLFPCNGRYTQYYHYGHYAVDIAQSGGSTIWAAEGGTVIKAQTGWNGGYGNMVIIDHGNGMQTLYAHFKELYVNVGDSVARGQAIGYMGNTGRVYGRTGIHLHFEVIINGVKKNPTAYF